MWYLHYRVPGGIATRNCDTRDEAVAIARGLLASGIDVQRLAPTDPERRSEAVDADELRRLASGV